MYTYLRRIDGVLYDESGTQYDNDGKPFLSKSPQAAEAFRKLQEEARKRSNTHLRKTDDEKEKDKKLQGINAKLESLREAAFHTKCREDWYRSVLNPKILSAWLNDIDENIKQLLSHRNHLLDKLCIAEEMMVELNRSYLDLNDQIDQLEAERRAEKATSNGEGKPKQPKAPETPASRAAKLLSQIPASLIEQWRAAGLDVEKLATQFTTT